MHSINIWALLQQNLIPWNTYAIAVRTATAKSPPPPLPKIFRYTVYLNFSTEARRLQLESMITYVCYPNRYIHISVSRLSSYGSVRVFKLLYKVQENNSHNNNTTTISTTTPAQIKHSQAVFRVCSYQLVVTRESIRKSLVKPAQSKWYWIRNLLKLCE